MTEEGSAPAFTAGFRFFNDRTGLYFHNGGKKRRDAMKMGEYTPPCDECGGACCRYVAVELDKPTKKTDYDNIRWYLLHQNVNVFIDHNGKWFIEFRTPCEKQREDSRCGIYSRRPKICRDHGNSEGECEFYDNPYRNYFATERQFLNYLEKKGIDWKYRRL